MKQSGALTVGCVQLNTSDDIASNIAAAEAGIRDARRAGAHFISLPENVSMMTCLTDEIRSRAMTENAHIALTRFKEVAEETGVWILIGSLGIRTSGTKVFNRSYLINASGEIVARYDKIHLFDVHLPNETYRESDSFQPGKSAVVAQTPWGLLGLSVCYDLRFPHLYRALAHAGAHFISVPSAFTQVTGEAHWHVLLRARAIETGSFIIAPAQCGNHPGKRQTFGHSLIVSPWGNVLADGGDRPGIITAEINLAEVERARTMLPTLLHDRSFDSPSKSTSEFVQRIERPATFS